jgi:hypothetical protein
MTKRDDIHGVLSMNVPPISPEGTGVTKKNIDHIRSEWKLKIKYTTKVEIHRKRKQYPWEIQHNNKVSKGNRIQKGKDIIERTLIKKKHDTIVEAINNLENKRSSLKNNNFPLTENEKKEYGEFIDKQWKRTESIEKLKSFLTDGLENHKWTCTMGSDLVKNDKIFNAATSDTTPIGLDEKVKASKKVNEWLATQNREPIQNNAASWNRMKVSFESAEAILNTKRVKDPKILFDSRYNEAFRSFYNPPFKKKSGKKAKVTGDDDNKDPNWIKDREGEIRFLTKISKELYKEFGRSPPRDTWENKIAFRNKMEIVLACICTGNEK